MDGALPYSRARKSGGGRGSQSGAIPASAEDMTRFLTNCFHGSVRLRRAGLLLLVTGAVAGASPAQVNPAKVIEGKEASYRLLSGATSFIVRLPDSAVARDFTFVNENPNAEGKLSIAVAEEWLRADDPGWSAVAGSVPFRHKRIFRLSLVGIEARYVKLTFAVDPSDATVISRGAKETAAKEKKAPLFATADPVR